MMKWSPRKINAAELLNLEEDSAGHLYWRGQRLTAAEYGKLGLVALLVGIASNLVRMAVDIGRVAGWWS